MKILLINTTRSHASGNIAYDLLENLNKNGFNCKLLTLYGNTDNSHVINYYTTSPDSFVNKNHRRVMKLLSGIWKKPPTNPKYYFWSYERINFFSLKTFKKRIKFEPEIIIYLFTGNLINARDISTISNHYNLRSFMLMMDMSALTGGCHYAWDCDGYKKICSKCPAILSGLMKDFSEKNMLYKRKWLNRTNITLVSASEHQYQQALESTLYKGKNICKILTGFDEYIFKPIDKAKLRIEMGIPLNKKIVLFGAVSLNEERKGFRFLWEALLLLKDKYQPVPDIHLLIFGNQGNIKDTKIPFPYTSLGYLPYSRINTAYQVSDLFICPSVEDSGPTMINQSVLCGTPVVSFNMGVAKDLVINDTSGYIAKVGDSSDLAYGIKKILDLSTKDYLDLSNKTRDLGLKKCSTSVCMKEWEKILLEEKLHL